VFKAYQGRQILKENTLRQMTQIRWSPLVLHFITLVLSLCITFRQIANMI